MIKFLHRVRNQWHTLPKRVQSNTFRGWICIRRETGIKANLCSDCAGISSTLQQQGFPTYFGACFAETRCRAFHLITSTFLHFTSDCWHVNSLKLTSLILCLLGVIKNVNYFLNYFLVSYLYSFSSLSTQMHSASLLDPFECCYYCISNITITNSMAYGTRRFNEAFTRTL